MARIIFNEKYEKKYKESHILANSEGEIVITPTGYDAVISIGEERYLFSLEDVRMLQKKGLIKIINDKGEEL